MGEAKRRKENDAANYGKSSILARARKDIDAVLDKQKKADSLTMAAAFFTNLENGCDLKEIKLLKSEIPKLYAKENLYFFALPKDKAANLDSANLVKGEDILHDFLAIFYPNYPKVEDEKQYLEYLLLNTDTVEKRKEIPPEKWAEIARSYIPEDVLLYLAEFSWDNQHDCLPAEYQEQFNRDRLPREFYEIEMCQKSRDWLEQYRDKLVKEDKLTLHQAGVIIGNLKISMAFYVLEDSSQREES